MHAKKRIVSALIMVNTRCLHNGLHFFAALSRGLVSVKLARARPSSSLCMLSLSTISDIEERVVLPEAVYRLKNCPKFAYANTNTLRTY
jgi:hypothetical protein